MMKLCDEVWFFGDPLTAGMRMESDCAKTQNKNTRYFGADWRDELTRVLREYQNTQGAKGKIKAK
jgi:hypothetical protein